MRHGKLLESLNKKSGDNKNFRRYSLSEMISESYKALYSFDRGTSLHKLAEAHLEDVRENPSDIDRLSRQLSNLKHLGSLVESGKLKDEELLVPEEKYTPVEPKDEEIKESVEEEETSEEEVIEEGAPIYKWGDWQSERGSACRVRFYSPSMDLTNQVIGVVYEKTEDQDYYGAEIYDNSTATVIEERTDDSYHFDTEEEAMEWVEEWFKSNESNSSDDAELTDEELEELTKHLAELRKNKKLPECDKKDGEETVNEDRDFEWSDDLWAVVKADGDYAGVPCRSWEEARQLSYHEGSHIYKMILDEDISESAAGNIKARKLVRRVSESDSCTKETKTYESLDLSGFGKKSSSKAFVKTFKKMHSKLKEGTALTRQESIALYKATNSAMTHLSVELEHNPEFLGMFKESATLLSEDTAKLLESMKNEKAPSKSTMKSLSKFVESLLREDEEEELPPIEDEEEEIIADEVPAESEETEEFDQEYADARVEMHKELADEFSDSEDPQVEDKLEQDKEEILGLDGITDEQVAELTGDETTVEAPEEEVEPEDVEENPEEETLEEEDEADITDDELAELKKHLKEMRKANRAK